MYARTHYAAIYACVHKQMSIPRVVDKILYMYGFMCVCTMTLHMISCTWYDMSDMHTRIYMHNILYTYAYIQTHTNGFLSTSYTLLHSVSNGLAAGNRPVCCFHTHTGPTDDDRSRRLNTRFKTSICTGEFNSKPLMPQCHHATCQSLLHSICTRRLFAERLCCLGATGACPEAFQFVWRGKMETMQLWLGSSHTTHILQLPSSSETSRLSRTYY